MLGKVIVGSTLAAFLILLLLLQTTTPSDIGPVGLLAVFFLLYVIILGCITELLWAGSKALNWLSRRVRTRRPIEPLSLTKAYYYSSVLALGPTMMLAMQSIGSLGVYEVGLVVIFLVIGILYISRRSRA